ncbi:MAG TPA: sulfatase-like hydrolase/transferase [Vicinamibacterales bacterium]|nr:sulfatase-like hydrolase/transferase [Vicinamibacterales bacterium]
MIRGCVVALLAVLAANAACTRRSDPPAPAAVKPSILLITLDTTRADAIGPEARGIETSAFNAVAARGRRFRQAYATVPETLPSHASMMTGLYPAGHGVHQNARYVPASAALLAEKLRAAGYRTAAFVSSFALAARFGLARGFDAYDDGQPAGGPERAARETTEAALRALSIDSGQPLFLWVHYYDPHTPYAPPEPFRSRFAANPYQGEVAAMDEQMGRLTQAFERQARGPVAVVVVADHGEGLGDHGEPQHGQLLYQSTMQVPLAIAGPGVEPAVIDEPVSTRRVFHTILDWAGLGADQSLRGRHEEVVLGEAMKPFLEYGWQPQVMAVAGRFKTILAGRLETYDLAADPGERHDLGSSAAPAGLRRSLDDYPAPSPDAARPPGNLDAEARRRLAALGYVGATSAPVVRRGAPRPADMTALFPVMEEAAALFAAGDFRRAIVPLRKILAADPYNLDAALRLATAHSTLGEEKEAAAAFENAGSIAPKSQDVRTYLALHYARTADWPRAIPLLEQVVAESPDRLTAVEALATLHARRGQAAMDQGRTAEALADFERARTLNPAGFTKDLELGVLYLASRRVTEARAALDRALASRPDDPMALFKRAQVSVLLNEPDARARIDRARQKADATTRVLIERERLFQR